MAHQVRAGDIDTCRAGRGRVRSTEQQAHAVRGPGTHRVGSSTCTEGDLLRAVVVLGKRVGMAGTAHCSRLTDSKRLTSYSQRTVTDPVLDEGDVLVVLCRQFPVGL